MNDALPVIAVIATVALSVIIVRFASALAKRVERRPADAALPDPAIGELREEVAAMQERLDFLERALVAQRNQSGRALPAGGRADPHVQTPS